jgi:hypothetical protein
MGPRSVVGEVLVIAERVLGERWEQLLRRLPPWVFEAAPEVPADLDDPGVQLEWVETVTLFCARIIRDRPFPKDNPLIGYETLRALLEWAQAPWPPQGKRTDEITWAVEAFDAGSMTEPDFVDWVCSWVASARQRPDGATA